MGARSLASNKKECKTYINGHSGNNLKEDTNSINSRRIINWRVSIKHGITLIIINGFQYGVLR